MKRQLVHMGLGFVVLSIGFATTPRAWGDDLSQALHIWGSGSSAVQQVPAEALERLKTTRVRKITDGLDSFHVGMLFEDGTAFLWGDNSFGQCTPPAGVGTANDPIQNLDVGTHHTIALMDDGRVECWGRTDNYACDVPSKLFGPSDPVIDVAAGTDYSACLLQSGTIIAWV